MWKITVVLQLFLFYFAVADKPCVPRQYNHPSYVCVCNSTYCDEISKIEPLAAGNYVAYHSSLDGARFEKDTGRLSRKIRKVARDIKTNDVNWFNFFFPAPKALGDATLTIYRNKTYQTIVGFGGSFTDATGFNLAKLSEETKLKFVESYFSREGLEYNLGRVPIGGTDFSTYPYAYNMQPENDTELSNFTLAMEDYEYKIPLIQLAKTMSTDQIRLVAAAWSPPVWMKTNKAFGGASRLLPEYYQTWADYHLRFLEMYDESYVKFWAMSTGNEPSNGVIPVMTFNTLGWMPREQSKWVAENLGPTIRGSRFADINLLALDDQRFSLPWWIEWMFENKETAQYIDGIATHWYWDDLIPPKSVDITHNLFPDKFLISTEACVGDKPWQTEKVELGSWVRAEMYIKNILEDLNHWYVAWIDWNLALDRQGGPNWFSNFVDSPVIVLPEDDEFVKQPMFYAMGHFSKFIPRGSKRVFVEKTTGDVDNVAFLRPDGGIAVVFYNPFDSDIVVTIQEQGKGSLKIDVPSRSVHSVVYW